MNESERAAVLAWIHAWERAGAVMQRTRRDALDNVDVEHAIENLDDAFESALSRLPARSGSGLIEMQAFFARGRQ
ncbi:MAG: hypothetical protein JRF37_00490 [Deltaproteobacteria bacterium]|nr:hypothetical protein [Deltaproteobacteria bacterium]